MSNHPEPRWLTRFAQVGGSHLYGRTGFSSGFTAFPGLRQGGQAVPPWEATLQGGVPATQHPPNQPSMPSSSAKPPPPKPPPANYPPPPTTASTRKPTPGTSSSGIPRPTVYGPVYFDDPWNNHDDVFFEPPPTKNAQATYVATPAQEKDPWQAYAAPPSTPAPKQPPGPPPAKAMPKAEGTTVTTEVKKVPKTIDPSTEV